MPEAQIEMTEDQMNAIAEFLLDRGMDPTDKEFMDHINTCDCCACNGAKALMVLVGDRISAIVEAGKKRHARRN